MGGGIAMVFANAGIPVLLKEADQAALDRGLANIQKNYATSVKRGRFTQQFVDERLKLIQPTLSYDDFGKADMVIEAVFEGMALKKEVFAQLDRVCKPGAILASNTSTLNIDEIAAVTSRASSVIGTHFFSPANVMRLLEIVRGKATGKEVIATCMQLSKKLGKVGVLVGNCRSFVGNRMFHPYVREATFLVEEGASVDAVDKALYDFGMAMGPLATLDLAGLDVGWRIRKEYRHLEKPGIRQPFAGDRLCEMGRFGQKTGAGWYKYDEARTAIPDPEVAEWTKEWSAEAGIAQRSIQASEIVDRCIYALINEGARILEEGYALRAGDIDIIYINGYGFPAYRGGPMWYADTVGLKKVYERIGEFHRAHGELWEPAPLLKELAAAGKTFADFDRARNSREKDERSGRRCQLANRACEVISRLLQYDPAGGVGRALHQGCSSQDASARSRRRSKTWSSAAGSRTGCKATTSRGCRRCWRVAGFDRGHHGEPVLFVGPAGNCDDGASDRERRRGRRDRRRSGERQPDRSRQRSQPRVKQKYPGVYMVMGETAEVVAKRYKIGRQAQDEYSLISQQRTARAQQEGFFAGEIAPMKVTKAILDKKTGEVIGTGRSVLRSRRVQSSRHHARRLARLEAALRS